MHTNKFIDEKVEYILEVTGVNAAYKDKPESTVADVEKYVETMRAIVTKTMCEVIHAASLDSNLAQHCAALKVQH